MYNKEFIQKQKELLLAEKEKIEKETKKLKRFPQYGGGDDDNIQELSDFESNLVIDSKMEFLLGKINKALAAIEKGNYGLCSSCKKEIGSARLSVMPWADICVECGKSKKR